MAEQTTSRNKRGAERRARSGGGEVARRRRSVTEAADGAGGAELVAQDLDEQPAAERSDVMEGPRTVRGELASIVREAALEVLGPIARNATTRTAKYAVSKGPTLAKDAILPRLKDTLGPRIEEAGGAGALAKGALSTVSGNRGGLLSKVGVGRSRDDDAAATGMARRLPVHEWMDVAVPLETAYNQFTQFEDFPDFIQSATKVEQVDDAHLVWHLTLWGMRREWEIEITDQRPNERIAWRSSGSEATGVVTFHPLSDRLTRIEVVVRLQPHGLVDKAAAGIRMSRRALRSDLTRFKAFIELRDEETGGWPGRIEEGDRQRSGKRAPRDEKRARKPSSRRRGRRGRDEELEDGEYESGEAYEEDEPEDQESETEDAEEPEDEEYDEEDEDYDEEDEDYDEEGPRAAEDEEGPEDEDPEEEEEPVTGRRPVRRRPPARPVRQSRGRR